MDAIPWFPPERGSAEFSGSFSQDVATDHLQWDVMLLLSSRGAEQESVSLVKFVELWPICDSIMVVLHFVQKHLSLSCYV